MKDFTSEICRLVDVNAAIAAVDATLPPINFEILSELLRLEIGNLKTIYSGI